MHTSFGGSFYNVATAAEDCGVQDAYVGDGNLVQARESIPAVSVTVWDYGSDALNRLVSVRRAGTLIARYAYDVLGRRIAKWVYSSASDGTPAYTRFIYHGDEVAFQADSAGSMGLKFTWGLGTDDLRAVQDGPGQNYYIVQDRLGSVRGLFERNGTWRAGGRFNPYGDLVAIDSAGPKPPIWYAWTGRELDEETGWFYHRARYYSPLLRRFVQEDPVGYDGGTNLYAYVEGQALEATDPTGTRSSTERNSSSGSGGGRRLGSPGLTWMNSGGPTVYIDGVATGNSGSTFLGSAGFTSATSTGFYSPYSNLPSGSVFDSPVCSRGNCTQSQPGRMMVRNGRLPYDDAIYSTMTEQDLLFFMVGGVQKKGASLVGMTAMEIISLTKKGGINRVFPSQLLNKTFSEIENLAKGGDRAARTAMKLLKSNRYNK